MPQKSPLDKVRQALFDPRLTWQERGLLAYIVLRQVVDREDPSLEEMVSSGPDGITRVRNILATLEEKGWLERRRGHDSDGRFVWRHVVLYPRR